VNLKPTNRTCCIAAGLVLLSLSGFPAQAGGKYYRWVDETGTTVNSDRPPPAGTDYEIITSTTNTRVPAAASEGNVSPNSTPSPGESADQSAKATTLPRTEVIKNPEACAAARQNLQTLDSHARIRKPDGNGSYRFLDQEEIAAERANAKATIEQNCE